jgi:hypothetical protein
LILVVEEGKARIVRMDHNDRSHQLKFHMEFFTPEAQEAVLRSWNEYEHFWKMTVPDGHPKVLLVNVNCGHRVSGQLSDYLCQMSVKAGSLAKAALREVSPAKPRLVSVPGGKPPTTQRRLNPSKKRRS